MWMFRDPLSHTFIDSTSLSIRQYMKKKHLTYFALGSVLLMQSCAQEGPVGSLSGDNRIFFRSYLPAVTQSRAGVIRSDNFTTAQVTCFNPEDKNHIDPETGVISPFFEDTHFEKADGNRFYAMEDPDCRWPNTDNLLHFFAYYPSVESMKGVTGEEFCNLVNYSKKTETGTVIDYRLEKFRVAKEIAHQSDFLTAYNTGKLTKDSENGIILDFSHHLARIELTAWSGSEKYDFEIAGVRIGSPLVEGDFDFTAIMQQSSRAYPWKNTGTQAPVEHIFGPDETIVLLSKHSGIHSTEADTAWIMGSAGSAMVLPMTERIEPWEGKDDPLTSGASYDTKKMYFSVLLRVTNRNGQLAYPYPNHDEKMNVVYLAADGQGKITRRLYKQGKEYYTNPEKDAESIFTPASGETIHSFGWAALPVPAKWEAGKIYTYSLNYTDGIGWHDPADPDPGEPIIERGHIPFAVTVEEWSEATDYEPDLNVPKR